MNSDDVMGSTPKKGTGFRVRGESPNQKGEDPRGTKASPAASEDWPGWWWVVVATECPCDVTSENHINVQWKQA